VVKARRMKWVRHVARIGDMRNAYRILAREPEGKRRLGRPRRRWDDRIRIDLTDIGWEGVNWIHLAHDRDQWRSL
jgi:hypothetical protein